MPAGLGGAVRLTFLLGEIGTGLRRNVSMAVSVVLVTMISMYLLGLGLLAQRQVDTMKDYWYDRVQVSIFMCVDKSLYPNCAGQATSPTQRDQIRAQLEQMKPPVKDVYYETQAEAYQRFKDQFRNSPLGDQATERAFADSYRVSLSDASKFDVIASSFQGAPGVGKVQDQKQLLEKFFTFMNVVSWSAIALAVLMVLCATLLMATTIRQTAFSRRRETGIMRLVGASNLTIEMPFIMETVLAAVVGAALAMGLLWATVRYGISGYLSTALVDTAFIGVPDVVAIAPWVVVGVVGLAVLTSGFTLRTGTCVFSRVSPSGGRLARRVTATAAVLVSAAALGVVGAPPGTADTGGDKRAADQRVQDLKAALDETASTLANAYLQLQATQAQLPAAQAALTKAQADERAADQHNDEVAAQLSVAKANEQRAVDTRDANTKQVEDMQRTLDSFAADLFQGGGGGSEMSVALGATTADDFATRVELADQVSSLAGDALRQLQNAKAEWTAQQAYLQSVQDEVAALKRQAEAALANARQANQVAAKATANLENLLAAQRTYAAQVEAQKADELKRLAQAEQEQAQLQALLEEQARQAAAAEAARAAAARAAGRAYTPVAGGSGFLAHAANGPITSPFGLRYHPILHIWKLHTGTDFGVPCGTPVYAAADGTVISAGWGGGDGNRIVVDHGIVSGVDLASTYNHLSSFVVRGGHVTRGQLIAYSGTTGYSTGCHLHFETLENGQFVNPMKWLGS